MSLKEIIILAVIIIFFLPLLVNFVSWAISSTTNPNPENIERGTELIAQAATPWWITAIQWIATHIKGIMATILILCVILLMRWIPEII
jgi:hypothetical protein